MAVEYNLGLDVDGTLVFHEYPELGDMITPVVEYLKENGIELYGINKNPTQHEWTSSPKPYCQHFLDDASIGCPLIFPEDGSRAYVDWDAAGPMVLEKLELRRKKYGN